MKLKVQKRIAAQILKCSTKRVVFDNESLNDIKEAITKEDMRRLVNNGIVTKVHKQGVSRVRARENHAQRMKGRRKGYGSRKGTAKARTPKKREWINRIRLQRVFLHELKSKQLITNESYWMLYLKAKGGFFRSRNHLKNYINDNKLFVQTNIIMK